MSGESYDYRPLAGSNGLKVFTNSLCGLYTVHERHFEIGDYQAVAQALGIGLYDGLKLLLSRQAELHLVLDVDPGLLEQHLHG